MRNQVLHAIFAVFFGVLIVGLCGVAGAAQQMASATIYDADGNQIASGLFIQIGDVVEVDIKNETLPVGVYGVHIHETGLCEGPNFTSAGGHFNPHNKEHGLNNPNGPHAGDLPNLEVTEDGEGFIQWPATEFTLASGEDDSLFDENGSAVIIHEHADDMVTDPSGNSGARIACGVVMEGVYADQEVPTRAELPDTASGGFSFGIMELILGVLALFLLYVIATRALG